MYKIEIERMVEEVKKRDAKKVLVQLPDGLKPRAREIADAIEAQCDAKVFIWLGGCFGACDLPMGVDDLGIDLMLAFGHNIFRKEYW